MATTDQQSHSAILDQLNTITPAPVWSAVVPQIRALLEGESAACYSISRGIDLFCWVGPFGDSFLRGVNAVLKSGSTNLFAYDPLNPAPEIRNRVIPLEQGLRLNGGRRGKSIEQMRERAYEKYDQLAVVLCDEDRYLACVGVARPERFGAREQRAMARLIPHLQQRLKLDAYMSQGPVLRAGLHASLDLIPGEACLVRANPRFLEVVEANELARRSLQRDRAGFIEELRQSLRANAIAPPFRASPVKASGVDSHFLLVRTTPPAAPEQPRIAAARVRWSLTPRQTTVLSRLAIGRANKAIANELGCAEVSVEFHVTALLRKSATSSRAELIARFWMQAV